MGKMIMIRINTYYVDHVVNILIIILECMLFSRDVLWVIIIHYYV